MVPSRRAWLTVALGVIIAVVLVIILQGRRAGVKSVDNVDKRTPEEVRLIESLEGPALFQAYCASCHGKDGKGGGPAASALKATVPDLTRIGQESGGKFPSDRVERIISGDEPGIPAHGSREMPIWGPIFKQIAWDQDLGRLCIYNLTKYLESLQQK
jgi:mono/diheme cytochrome c family protein